ncbi:sulfurtransferase [Humibacter ginsenosidimutans]|uniref:Sulfurtransferase n=1 Tax=Humibacter ginsenosidimutans TaxID=2599293 RepID=A0A5B8M2S4_9MICO|nr:sulfurtransferase [Humibacter ginsenosidimutans]QDZ13940.1 sulfurtransferase [Humibacter ginsenosidimutans]
MSERSDVLITADDLADLIDAGRRNDRAVVILDVRWRLDRPDGRLDHAAGHIPGAVYVDLDRQLAEVGDPKEGRHPVPAVERLQRDARSWGLDDGSEVVVYDDLANMSAARAWWLLRHAGLDSVRMLDGGLRAWTQSGRALESGETTPRPGTVVLRYGRLPVVTMDEAAEVAADGVLLDARAPERYRGETEPIDPRAGHVPGAVNAPTTGNVDDTGRFLSAEALRDRFAALGVRGDIPVAGYCGSGVTGAHTVAALMIAGYEAALYPGSWSQWSNHPDRPVATGEEHRILHGE